MVVDHAKRSGEVEKSKKGQFLVDYRVDDVIENPQKSHFSGMALLISQLLSQHKSILGQVHDKLLVHHPL